MLKLFQNISVLRKVGAQRAAAYEKLDITSPYDLLFHFPRSYIDFSSPVPVADSVIDETNLLCVQLLSKKEPVRINNNLTIYSASAADSSGTVAINFFNFPYTLNSMSVGSYYFVCGKLQMRGTRLEVNSPKIYDFSEKKKIIPQYSLVSGLKMNQVTENVEEAISLMKQIEFEWLPSRLLQKYNLCSIQTAIENIHFPQSMDKAREARKRLAFDESLELQLGMLMMKTRKKSSDAPAAGSDTDVDVFLDSLGFVCTDDQKKAVYQIKEDMSKNIPMNRLLQGDVGSGKTVVAAAACYIAFKNNMQSALMAPTEILAQQHYKTLCGFFEKFGVNIVLLTSSLPAKKKREVMEDISGKKADIIVGTNAIMQKNVEYGNLGLVITDEQHRFGVEQRNALAEKGKSPHKLVMSATPIPRTLALMMYGELELSVIKQMPKGRIPIKTFAVTGKLRDRAYKFLSGEINKGHQAYVICPLIEQSEKMDDKKSVTEYTEKLRSIMPQYNIEMLHGKMTPKQKEDVMERFKDGDVQILVSTTVVEVGVDAPNATVMMIEDAERFGLSQLHQLRGRVGRGDYQSYCIVLTEKAGDEIRKRLRAFSSSSDGFEIAEEDLRQRGAGDFFGSRQHGLPPLKIADLTKDIKLFEQTREAALDLIERDPELKESENRGLRLEVMKLFARAGSGDLD